MSTAFRWKVRGCGTVRLHRRCAGTFALHAGASGTSVGVLTSVWWAGSPRLVADVAVRRGHTGATRRAGAGTRCGPTGRGLDRPIDRRGAWRAGPLACVCRSVPTWLSAHTLDHPLPHQRPYTQCVTDLTRTHQATIILPAMSTTSTQYPLTLTRARALSYRTPTMSPAMMMSEVGGWVRVRVQGRGGGWGWSWG